MALLLAARAQRALYMVTTSQVVAGNYVFGHIYKWRGGEGGA
jgi:hypothetical protein